ncbi:BlaI/MecI/CopY family transcriptional regulator [Schlesneria paludicola]|uniref:BlaI/MecI/CopY family transcriptional regulator n=1 Tax=Schlesneria paludicola TaxID=360056 RepID=UPI00029A97F8|nr:BlaI/MecI/CopY family transcriptional regulator [Schlesneria paludicola]
MSRFTAGELKVMQLLWEHGELKPTELQQLYPEPIKNPALRSYLVILVEKGHVVRRKVGKAFFYRAKTPRQRAFSSMLSDLVKTFCAGSVEQLLMTLVRKEQLSADDLLELKRLADEPALDVSEAAESGPKKRGTKET